MEKNHQDIACGHKAFLFRELWIPYHAGRTRDDKSSRTLPEKRTVYLSTLGKRVENSKNIGQAILSRNWHQIHQNFRASSKNVGQRWSERNPQELSGVLKYLSERPRFWTAQFVKLKNPLDNMPTMIDPPVKIWEDNPPHLPTPRSSALSSTRKKMQTLWKTHLPEITNAQTHVPWWNLY